MYNGQLHFLWWLSVLGPLVGAAGLWVLLGRGKRIAIAGECRKCGYDVSQRPAESVRCSECGTDLSAAGAVRLWRRQKLGWWRKTWLSLATVALLSLTGLVVYQTPVKAYPPVLPTIVLEWLTRTDWNIGDSALEEIGLNRRKYDAAADRWLRRKFIDTCKTAGFGKLSRSRNVAWDNVLTAIQPQTVYGKIAGQTPWLTRKEALEAVGQGWGALVAAPTVSARTQIKVGHGLAIAATVKPARSQAVVRVLLEAMDGTWPLGSLTARIDTRPDAPANILRSHSFIWMEEQVTVPMDYGNVVPAGIALGKHDLYVRCDVWLPGGDEAAYRASKPSQTFWKIIPVEVVGSDALIGKPVWGAEAGEEIGRALRARAFSDRRHVTVNVIRENGPTAPGAFEVWLMKPVPVRIGGLILSGGSGITEMMGGIGTDKDLTPQEIPTGPTCDIELRANGDVLLERVSGETYWNGTLRLEGVPLGKSDGDGDGMISALTTPKPARVVVIPATMPTSRTGSSNPSTVP